MQISALHSKRKAGRGYTLIELLLTVVLVLLLAGATVFNFDTLGRSANFDEGVSKMESLVRYARAQAANTGRQVQIVFESTTTTATNKPAGKVHLTWESDPLGQPGHFEELGGADMFLEGLSDLVQVKEVKLPYQFGESSTTETMTAEDDWFADEGFATESRPPIAFYPDGSSDSAEIVLMACGPEDTRQVSVYLEGITGAIHRQVLAEAGEVPTTEEVATESRSLEKPK